MSNNKLPSLFSDFAYNFNPSSLPISSINIFKICLADWVSVSIAAQNCEVAKKILSLADDDGGVQESFIFGHKSYVSCKTAALINGTISHALDYDDTHFDYLGHPSVVVLSSALAISDKYKLSFEEFKNASIIGMETSCRIGKWLGRKHYRSGFHITSTSGIFGATIAVSKLMGLSSEQIENALCIATSHSSGLKEQFGSMVKPYHVGMAANSAIQSSILSKNGLEASINSFDGPQGFGKTHNSEFNYDSFDNLGKLFIFEKLTHKFHACCHGTHAMIEAINNLKIKFKINSDLIQEINIFVHPQYLNVCNINNPKTSLETKFSFKMIAAMVVSGIDTSKPESFSDKLCINKNLISIMEKTKVISSSNIVETSTKVKIILSDKSEFNEEYDLKKLVEPTDRKNKMMDKTSSLLGELKSNSLWDTIQEEELLPSKWIWNNYNKYL